MSLLLTTAILCCVYVCHILLLMMQGHADAVYQHVLRMNGLPWSTRNEDVRKFFKECSVIDDLDGIHICINKEGRPSGDAYVIFETEQVYTNY
jgi:RNA recognition motif. (a.k.a. RRM, RBD, or RNP domain)